MRLPEDSELIRRIPHANSEDEPIGGEVVVAHVAGLQGPQVSGPTSTEHGTVHSWEWR